MAKTHACRRCASKGEIQAYLHVKGGVCFRCWGTGLDLPEIEQELRRAVDQLRHQWRSARRAGAARDVLEKIEVSGRKAVRALNAHQVDAQAQRAKFATPSR